MDEQDRRGPQRGRPLADARDLAHAVVGHAEGPHGRGDRERHRLAERGRGRSRAGSRPGRLGAARPALSQVAHAAWWISVRIASSRNLRVPVGSRTVVTWPPLPASAGVSTPRTPCDGKAHSILSKRTTRSLAVCTAASGHDMMATQTHDGVTVLPTHPCGPGGREVARLYVRATLGRSSAPAPGSAPALQPAWRYTNSRRRSAPSGGACHRPASS